MPTDIDTPIPFTISFPLEVPANSAKEARRRAKEWRERGHVAYEIGRPRWNPDTLLETVEWFTHIEGIE